MTTLDLIATAHRELAAVAACLTGTFVGYQPDDTERHIVDEVIGALGQARAHLHNSHPDANTTPTEPTTSEVGRFGDQVHSALKHLRHAKAALAAVDNLPDVRDARNEVGMAEIMLGDVAAFLADRT